MLDYIDRNRLSLSQFEDIYRRDHGVGLSDKQRRVIQGHFGIIGDRFKKHTRFRVHNQRRAFRIFRKRPDAKEVQVVRGRKNRLVTRYIRDKRGQIHKTGRDGRFQHFTKRERKGFRLSAKREQTINS